MRNKLSLIVLISLVLSACDNGKSPAGASAGAGESTGTNRAETISRSTNLESKKTITMTSEMPIMPLMVKAMRAMVPDPDDYNLAAIECALSRGTQTIEAMRKEAVGMDLPEHVHHMLAQDYDYHVAACAAYMALLAVRPRNGWEVDALSDSPAVRDYMNNELVAALSAAEILSPIALDISRQPGKTEAEYLELITAQMTEFAPMFLPFYDEELAKKRAFTKDLTGSGNIHFTTTDGYDFLADGSGSNVMNQGVDWFGKGSLKGTVYRVVMTQSNTIGISRTKGGSTTRDTGTREDNGATVQTQ